MNPKTPGLDPTPDANRDPITGAPGSHPIGTGVGALAGGVAAGAAIGTMAGPVARRSARRSAPLRAVWRDTAWPR
jgi:hypothetical protein